MASHLINPAKTVFFCCDIQTRFRECSSSDDGVHLRELELTLGPASRGRGTTESAIYGWASVIHTAEKMTRFAKVRLGCPSSLCCPACREDAGEDGRVITRKLTSTNDCMQILNIPILATEQNPKGTSPILRSLSAYEHHHPSVPFSS